jgi:hypothetical protein
MFAVDSCFESVRRTVVRLDLTTELADGTADTGDDIGSVEHDPDDEWADFDVAALKMKKFEL